MNAIDIAVSKNYTSSHYIYLVIGLIYALLMSLIVDKVLDHSKVDKACSMDSGMRIISYSGTSHNTKYTNDADRICDVLTKKYKSKKFTTMIMLGVCSMLLGAFFISNSPEYHTGSLGISLGGVLMIIYYIMRNWSSLNENLKIGVYGSTLMMLLYGSTKLIN